jgi:hypothetical protein
MATMAPSRPTGVTPNAHHMVHAIMSNARVRHHSTLSFHVCDTLMPTECPTPIPDTGQMPTAGAIYYTLYLVYFHFIGSVIV